MLETNKRLLFGAWVQPPHVHSQEERRNHFNEKIHQLVKRALKHKLLIWRQMAHLNKHIINGGIHHSVTLRCEIGHLLVPPQENCKGNDIFYISFHLLSHPLIFAADQPSG